MADLLWVQHACFPLVVWVTQRLGFLNRKVRTALGLTMVAVLLVMALLGVITGLTVQYKKTNHQEDLTIVKTFELREHFEDLTLRTTRICSRTNTTGRPSTPTNR